MAAPLLSYICRSKNSALVSDTTGSSKMPCTTDEVCNETHLKLHYTTIEKLNPPQIKTGRLSCIIKINSYSHCNGCTWCK